MTWNKLDAKQKTSIFLVVVGIAILWLLAPSGGTPPRRAPRPPARPPVRQAPRPSGRGRGTAARVATPASGLPARWRAATVPVAALLRWAAMDGVIRRRSDKNPGAREALCGPDVTAFSVAPGGHAHELT